MRVAPFGPGPAPRLGFAAAVIAFALLLTPGLFPSIAGGLGPTAGSGGAVALRGNNCPNGNYASAFRIWEPNPKGTIVAGTNVTIEFQAQTLNWQPSDGNVTMYTPTIFAKLPILPKGNLTITLPPKSFPIPSSGWSNLSYTTFSKTVTANTTFSTVAASLTTELVAVQTSAPYGLNLSLEWRWIVTPPGGHSRVGGWSPIKHTLTPVSHVTIVPYLPTGSHMTLGTVWNATVNGSTANVAFAVEIENGTAAWPRGLHDFTAPPTNGTPFQATIPLFYTRPNVTVPGPILVHVHELCRGLISNTLVYGGYASSTTLRVGSNLAACPTVVYNGTSYSNGTQITVTPSRNFLPLAVPSCPGHNFSSWTETGPVIVHELAASNTTLQITYRGGVVANWV